MLHRELEVGRLVITTMNTRRLPARIVCLTTETVEVLYALGEDARISINPPARALPSLC